MSDNPPAIIPEIDKDGYPTEATLKALCEWPLSDPAGALDYLAAAWWMPEFGVSRELSPAEAEVVHADPGDRFLWLATGGWSGNETLIFEFKKNLCFSWTWRLHAHGGLWIFQYPPGDRSAG